ncbi:flagellin [Anaerocolumna cellulosilytica]|uniref:Flagellin n=1 Tax=Anaerocolumna cellulosilytica TaxID=433286 RepID=A0A6S6R060_9FIRM|nr:flagellin [Anaerocolumna cellulosilytica]MBB5195722.1 flagellin [Anaerocolumna cellulosilytica]BCJ92942.1 flagellin [Anaerocolumna cellulosilytica]
MIIQHNMQSANTNRQLGITTGNLSKSTEKLSSGYRINRAGDDAAGLSISEKMRGQIRGLEQASTNAQDGISLIQTAEGALNETHSILQRMRELTVQAANDTNVSVDRASIQKELQALTSEITRIGSQTEFNTMKLLGGSFSATALNLQVGANSGQNISFNIQDMRASALELTQTAIGSAVSTYTKATAFISVVNAAITKVSDQRSKLGAVQNRLEHTIANADNTAENLQAAESRIRDVNMANEMVTYSKNNILQQAAQSMLAQANQSSQGVLSLLR